MKYERMEPAVFRSRPNRFLAYVETARGEEICHVKNTGRCRELLVPDAEIWVQRNENPARKTPLDLIAVRKGARLINMDSQAPNRVAAEWLERGGAGFAGFDPFSREVRIRPEVRFGSSRIDLYLEEGARRMYLEVKGVTLEEEGVARFPDAPTQRGVKHLEELMRCRLEGYEAGILFVIQMKGIRYLEPNDRTHPAFGETLRRAADCGVQVMAVDCLTGPELLEADQPVEVRL